MNKEPLLSRGNLVFAGLAIAAACTPLIVHAYGSTLHGWRSRAAMQIASQVPAFSGVIAKQEELINCDMNDPSKLGLAPVSTRVFALSADGSISNTTTSPAKGTTDLIIRRADGIRINAYPHAKVKTSLRARDAEPAVSHRIGMGNPKDDCRTDFAATARTALTKIGEETLLGYRAVKLYKETPTARHTTWKLPDVGCFEAQILNEWIKDGKIIGNSFIRTVSLQIGAVPASYFQAPADLVEKSPSEVIEALLVYKLIHQSKLSPEKAVEVAKAETAAERDRAAKAGKKAPGDYYDAAYAKQRYDGR